MAILCNHTDVLAIAEWGAKQPVERLRQLGFPTGVTPCQSTLQRLFRKLDGHALATALKLAFAPTTVPDPDARGSQGVSLDAKAECGRLHYESGGCPVHLLSAFCHDHGIVLAQEPHPEGTRHGADKVEA